MKDLLSRFMQTAWNVPGKIDLLSFCRSNSKSNCHHPVRRIPPNDCLQVYKPPVIPRCQLPPELPWSNQTLVQRAHWLAGNRDTTSTKQPPSPNQLWAWRHHSSQLSIPNTPLYLQINRTSMMKSLRLCHVGLPALVRKQAAHPRRYITLLGELQASHSSSDLIFKHIQQQQTVRLITTTSNKMSLWSWRIPMVLLFLLTSSDSQNCVK